MFFIFFQPKIHFFVRLFLYFSLKLVLVDTYNRHLIMSTHNVIFARSKNSGSKKTYFSYRDYMDVATDLGVHCLHIA